MQNLLNPSPTAIHELSILNNDRKHVISQFTDFYQDHWQIIELEYNAPQLNLATEEVLLKYVGLGQIPQTIRFWRNPNSVIIGRFQHAKWETNLNACRAFGTTIHRRSTGGGAVYQDLGNLNWTICCKRDSPLIPKEVPTLIEQLSGSIVHGVRALGLYAQYDPVDTYIHIKQRKITGMASAIKSRAVLLHGTLLVNSNLNILNQVLQAPTEPIPNISDKSRPKWVRSKKREVTSLQQELGRPVTMKEVISHLSSSFQQNLENNYRSDMI